jgi:uncharacterized protein (TIGR03000 family)
MRHFLLSAALAASVMSLPVGRLAAALPERAPATIDVTLPADAQLTVDGQSTRSTSDHRLFITPPLAAGKAFQYTFTAKFVREGKTITVEQNVLVRAGRETFVSLDLPRETFAGSPLPGDYRYTYGAGPTETRAYYYAPDSSRPPAPTVVDFYGRPIPSGGFHPTYWGTDPSDPFYVSSGQ